MKKAHVLAVLLVSGLVACGAPKPPPTVAELTEEAAKGSEEAARELIVKLGEGASRDDRALAYKGLVENGAKFGQLITAALTDKDPARREHALALAANLRLPGTFEAAKEALADPSFTRPHAAAWALGELQDERAIPLLADAMVRFGPGFSAREAARAISRYGKKAAGPLVERYPRMDGEVKSYAIRILGEMRAPEGRPVIIAALKDPKYRADAVWAVGANGRIGEPVDLVPYLGDSDPRVRAEACRAAGVMVVRETAPTLDRMRAKDPDMVVREWAARGLGLLTDTPEKYLAKDGSWKEPDQLYH